MKSSKESQNHHLRVVQANMDQKTNCNSSTGLREILEADERYQFKLSEILRQRGVPFLLVIDSDGNLEYSSIPEQFPFQDQKNLKQGIGTGAPTLSFRQRRPDCRRPVGGRQAGRTQFTAGSGRSLLQHQDISAAQFDGA